MFSPDGLRAAIESVGSASARMVVIPGRDLPAHLVSDTLQSTLAWCDAVRVPTTRSVWAPGSPMVVDRVSLLRLRGFDEKQKKASRAFCDLKLRMKRLGVAMDQRAATAVHGFVLPVVQDTDVLGAPRDSAASIAKRLSLLEEDKSYIRNVLEWKNRPVDAPPLVTVAVATYNVRIICGQYQLSFDADGWRLRTHHRGRWVYR